MNYVALFYPSNKTKYKTLYIVQPMGNETETKTSNAILPQHKPTGHAGKMIFLLCLLNGHGLQSSEDAVFTQLATEMDNWFLLAVMQPLSILNTSCQKLSRTHTCHQVTELNTRSIQ